MTSGEPLSRTWGIRGPSPAPPVLRMCFCLWSRSWSRFQGRSLEGAPCCRDHLDWVCAAAQVKMLHEPEDPGVRAWRPHLAAAADVPAKWVGLPAGGTCPLHPALAGLFLLCLPVPNQKPLLCPPSFPGLLSLSTTLTVGASALSSSYAEGWFSEVWFVPVHLCSLENLQSDSDVGVVSSSAPPKSRSPRMPCSQISHFPLTLIWDMPLFCSFTKFKVFSFGSSYSSVFTS